MNDMATILFRPICSKCGKQIHDVIDYSMARSSVGKIGCISPLYCPECHAIFETIEMPVSLPYDNTAKDELEDMVSKAIEHCKICQCNGCPFKGRGSSCISILEYLIKTKEDKKGE